MNARQGFRGNTNGSKHHPLTQQQSYHIIQQLINKVKKLKHEKSLLIRRIQDLLKIIHDHKMHSSRLKERMRLHSISGLPNHLQMEEDMAMFFSRISPDTQLSGAFILIRLDQNYDAIQRTLKSNMSEWVLYQISQRIIALLESRRIYHIRDREFLIVLKGSYETQDIVRLTKYIQREISQPHIFSGYNVHVHSVAGITTFPEQGIGKSNLLQNADLALEWAATAGKSFALYNDFMREQVVEKIDLQNSIIKALEQQSIAELDKQFTAYFQPIVEIEIEYETIQIKNHYAEALIRWNHPRLGLVQPNQFISLAEETGLIIPLGKWMLFHVAQSVHTWNQEGLQCRGVSVNISPRQFRNEDLHDILKSILHAYHIKPYQFHLELTEGTLIDEPLKMISFMTELHEGGVGFSLDDFGTGYSSLSYVHKLPAGYLKIDKSFIFNLQKDEKSRAIVRAIIALAHELGFRIIAEGVETREQLNFLYDEGVRYIQGFYVSKPLPERDYVNFLKNTCV